MKQKIKSMLICFFYGQGIIHKEFKPAGQIANQFFYLEALERGCDVTTHCTRLDAASLNSTWQTLLMNL